VFSALVEALAIDASLLALGSPRTLDARTPEDCAPKAWAAALAGRQRFADEGWADKAKAFGWSEGDLFALPRRWACVAQCGVAWLVGERKVVDVTADAIEIETASGARINFYRRCAVLA
jgi:hypothetical protein